MQRRHPPAGRSDLYRDIGVALALAVLFIEAVSAVLPTYGMQEFLFNTGGPQPQEAATSDFNCDGRPDVVWVQAQFQSSTTYPFRFFLSDGAGSFTNGTAQVVTGTVPTVQWPRKMLVEDFNGDGRADVFVADTGDDKPPFPGYQNTLLLSTPDCHWVNGTSGLPQQLDLTHSAAAADIDGDDDLDLFTGNYWGGQQPQIPPQILLNDGTGRFAVLAGALPPVYTTLSQNAFTTVAFVDVDADGDPDLVLGADERTPSSAVLLNDGTGRFTSLPNAIPAKLFTPTAIVLDIKGLDLTGDGKQDLVMAETNSLPYYQGRWLQILVNNGNGTFRDETAQRMPQSTNINTWFKFIEIVDVDGDGHLDVVGKVPYQTSSNGGGDHVFWIDNGSGVFTRALLFGSTPRLDGVFGFVDLNANGHRDFVTMGEVWTQRVRNTGPVLTPGIPQSVRATRLRQDRVRLTWPYVWGATQYQIWRSASPGGAGFLLDTTAALSFDDLTASTTTMYYSVRAVNSAGASLPSADAPGALAVLAPPVFVTQPSSQSALIGGALQFSATASGVPAPGYQWQMSSDGGTSWTNLANTAPYSGVTTPTLVVSNATAALNGIRYRCIASNSSGSTASQVVSATLTLYTPFTDNSLVPGSTAIKAVHVAELRTRINAVRARNALPPYAYTTGAIVPGSTPVRAADILEMRTALSQVYAAAGLSVPTYGTAPAAGAAIAAAHIAQLRLALVVVEPLASSLFNFTGGLAGARKGVRFQGTDTPMGNGADVRAGSIVIGGVPGTGVFIHPPYLGQVGGETFVEYDVPIPPRAILQFAVGVQDDASCTDGVTFKVTSGGTELWRQHHTRTGFHDVVLRLDAYGGATVPLRFSSHPGPNNNPNCDWAWWTRLALGTLPE
jgi:hypothetical protein